MVSICRRLDGLPLAIELAAARLPSLSLSGLADRLDQRFRLLTGGSRTAPERQQTLEAAVDWSYSLLHGAEQLLLGRLSVFAEGFDLDAAEAVCGFGDIEVEPARDIIMHATRLDPDNPWAKFAARSIEKTGGQKPNMLPNLGGSLPNEVFTDILGMPTVWVPHSYAACSQHAPNEHLLAPVARDGLRLMTGLFWDLGAEGRPR